MEVRLPNAGMLGGCESMSTLPFILQPDASFWCKHAQLAT